MRNMKFLGLGLSILFSAGAASAGDSGIDQLKTQIISELSAHYHLDPADLGPSSIEIRRLSKDAGKSYHATGQFTLHWDKPRNLDESAREVAQNNVCALFPDKCVVGFHHTIYLDVTVTQDPVSGDVKINGQTSLDVTFAQQREAEEHERTNEAAENEAKRAVKAEEDIKLRKAAERSKRDQDVQALVAQQKEDLNAFRQKQKEELQDIADKRAKVYDRTAADRDAKTHVSDTLINMLQAAHMRDIRSGSYSSRSAGLREQALANLERSAPSASSGSITEEERDVDKETEALMRKQEVDLEAFTLKQEEEKARLKSAPYDREM